METFIERMCQIPSSEISENVTWGPRCQEKRNYNIIEHGSRPISFEESYYDSYSIKNSSKNSSTDMRKLRQRHQRVIKTTNNPPNESITSMVREFNGGNISIDSLEKKLTEQQKPEEDSLEKSSSSISLYNTAEESLNITDSTQVFKNNALMSNLPSRETNKLYDDLDDQISVTESMISCLVDLSVDDSDGLRDRRIDLMEKKQESKDSENKVFSSAELILKDFNKLIG